MGLDKKEIKKNKYSIISGLISALLLFLIFHFGNILGLTNHSKETSYKIIVLFLYSVLLLGTLFVTFYSVKSKNDPDKRIFGFRMWVKILGFCILILASFELYQFFKIANNDQIPPFLIKIINATDTTQVINKNADISITQPTSPLMNSQVDFKRGFLSQNNIIKKIIIAKKDSTIVTLSFEKSKQLYELLESEQFEMTVILSIGNGKFITISDIPFTKSILKNNYSAYTIK